MINKGKNKKTHKAENLFVALSLALNKDMGITAKKSSAYSGIFLFFPSSIYSRFAHHESCTSGNVIVIDQEMNHWLRYASPAGVSHVGRRDVLGISHFISYR